MAYAGIDRKRFAQLLDLGIDDDELRRFFLDSRVQLIQRGARVQNLPHGKSNRIRVLTQSLPSSTDKVVQKWFSENIRIFDPESLSDAISKLRLYEEFGESPPEDEARRLARTCLVHLFTAEPPELLEFLKPAKTEPAVEPKAAASPPIVDSATRWLPSLAAALIDLEEGRDPDEQLSVLPPEAAALIAGLYAIRTDNEAEVRLALAALEAQSETHELLSAHAKRRADLRTRGAEAPTGLQVVEPEEADSSTEFDMDRDEVLAVCTKDAPETQVFLRPLALRAGASWVSLADVGVRERIFRTSGNLMAFAGRNYPKQPRLWEMGIWRVAKNEFAKPTDRTNFHISSDKVPVYEARAVPFASVDYDSVREFIKHHAVVGGPEAMKTTLFLLRDGLIVGSALGKDLSQDEGFEAGLPCWHALHALRFEGRLFVPGPLPPSRSYECESLASSLRKLVAPDKSAADRLTRAQLKRLLEMINSGEAHLNAARAARLRAELQVLDEHEGAMSVLLDAAIEQPRIAEEVNRLVQTRVSALVAEREDLRKGVEEQRRLLSVAIEERKQAEREQRAMSPAVAKAVRGSFEKARREAFETLGQVAVFKALIDGATEAPATRPSVERSALPSTIPGPSGERVRASRAIAGSAVAAMLQRLGTTPKLAAALQVVGQLAHESGLVLLVEGVAARLAAEAWLGEGGRSGKVLECRVGLTDDLMVQDLVAGELSALAILDANLSPLDIYARPLIDAVQQRIAALNEQGLAARVVMSLSGGLAALPIPPVVESISLRVRLDHVPMFVSEADARAKLEGIGASDSPDGWIARLWRPAAVRVLTRLQTMSQEEVALAMSVLDEATEPLRG